MTLPNRITWRRGAMLLAPLLLITFGARANAGPNGMAGIDRDYQAQPTCQPAAPSESGFPPAQGCFNAANLANMAADPHDLVQGQPLGPANGARESLAVDAYKRGQVKLGTDQGGAKPTIVFGATSDGGGR